MRTHGLLVALFTLPLLVGLLTLPPLAAPAWADCITVGTIQVTAPAGVTSQLWVQNANGVFNIVDVKDSSIWVATPDGATFTTLLVINSTGGTVEPTISIRQLSGEVIVAGTVPIDAGATFALGINECGG